MVRRIPQWGLTRQAETLDGIEVAARDLIARFVGMANVGDAYSAAVEAVDAERPK